MAVLGGCPWPWWISVFPFSAWRWGMLLCIACSHGLDYSIGVAFEKSRIVSILN